MMSFDISKFASTVPSCRPRTIETVTEEAKEAVAQIATGFMDLGDRLIEAKEMLPHGEWLPWLEREMKFSERTAQKYMAIAREYKGNPKLASDLGSEKAFALLALPKEEREQIAAEGITVDGKTKAASDLTTREVKQIVAERGGKERRIRRRTNGDRYRAMSDEELAALIMCPYEDYGCVKAGAECVACTLEYLRSEVE